MKITTAKEKFDYAIWYILDRLERKKLPYPNKKVVDYMMNINIKYQASFLFGLERDVIQFLKDKKVIKQIGEPDIYESGKSGTPKYKAYETYHFKILNKFNDYYKKYTGLLKGKTNTNNLLIFSQNGEIAFTDGQGKSFNGKLGRNTNPYRTLSLLINNPDNKFFTFDEIVKTLKEPRLGGEDSTNERRARDTINSIKKALKYNGKNLFVSDNGFKLKRDIQIIR